MSIPSYLTGHESAYEANPRQAAIDWFDNARFGLFLHYGLYSVLERGEWAMLHETIPLEEYELLKNQFTAEHFDADMITDLACEAEMKYVTITTRHHDSFCLFKSQQTDYHSLNAPAGRDLVGELASQCQKKNLGLFLYYSYSLDWRHPYFLPASVWKQMRPAYDSQPKAYLWEKDEDFRHYMNFVHAQLRELLTNYGPVAGVWFDPLSTYFARPDLFPIHETYALIRELQPQALISFKYGANGDEDFYAPERTNQTPKIHISESFGETIGQLAEDAWLKNKNKPLEICDTLQPYWWGYVKEQDANHRTVDEVMDMLGNAGAQNANLLLNTGPMPDGSIFPDDITTLKEVGQRIRAEGWPRLIRAPQMANTTGLTAL